MIGRQMATSNETEKKPLKLTRPGRLEIKKTIDAGQVRQSFPHGRSKTVSVEVKKKRTFAPNEGGRMTEVTADTTVPPEEILAIENAIEALHAPASDRRRTRDPRQGAGGREEGRRAPPRPEVENRRKAEEEAVRRQAEEAEERRQNEERARIEAEARSKLDATSPKAKTDGVKVPGAKTAEAPAALRPGKPGSRGAEVAVEEEEEEPARAKRAGKLTAAKPVPAPRRLEPRRANRKVTISEALGDSDEERSRSLASVRRAREKEKQRALEMRADGQQLKVVRDVTIPETITVQDLANRMAERSADVIKTLMKMGVMATINQAIDADTAELVATEFGHRVQPRRRSRYRDRPRRHGRRSREPAAAARRS